MPWVTSNDKPDFVKRKRVADLESDGEVAPIVSEVEADAAVPEESLPLLHQLLDPLQGAAVTDAALCAWLLGLLHPIREV